MDEDTFNLETRKFLKVFGVTAQREIEKAVRSALEDGRLDGDETLGVHATLVIDGLPSEVVVDGSIALGASTRSAADGQ
jgi:Family of unknown function (DUF6494)